LKGSSKTPLGVTAIEYGLIAALIVIGALLAVNSVGLKLNLSRSPASRKVFALPECTKAAP